MKMILIMKLIVICQICFMMTKCAVRTLCISMHHAFIVCIPSAFLGSVHYLRPGVVVWQNWSPPKKLPPPPLSRIHGIHGKQISPHPHDTVRKFLSTSPPLPRHILKAFFMCLSSNTCNVSFTKKPQRNNALKKKILFLPRPSLLHENRSWNFCPHAPPLAHHQPPWP